MRVSQDLDHWIVRQESSQFIVTNRKPSHEIGEDLPLQRIWQAYEQLVHVHLHRRMYYSDYYHSLLL